MDFSGIPTQSTKNRANHSFMTSNQTMSPKHGQDLLKTLPGMASRDFNESTFCSPNSHSPPIPDPSKQAHPDLDRYPAPLTMDLVEGKDELPTGHITRPRNAFMIYRSECLAQNKISRDVEHDNRHISRIVGHCWQKLSQEEKAIWQQKAAEEKIQHKNKYPNYKFSPVPRSKKPLKRNSKRNGEKDMERCRQVADLLLSGKQGEELAVAIKQIDLENADDNDRQALTAPKSSQNRADSRPPAFLNPLCRPSGSSAEIYPVVSSSNNYSPQQYYRCPPVSPASPNFMSGENETRHPYHIGTAYASSSGQILPTRKHSSRVPPHLELPQSTSFNPVNANEAQVQHDTFLNARGYYRNLL